MGTREELSLISGGSWDRASRNAITRSKRGVIFGPESPTCQKAGLTLFYTTKVQSCRRRLTPLSLLFKVSRPQLHPFFESIHFSQRAWCPRIPCFVENGMLENFRPPSSTTSGQRSYSSHWWQRVWVTPQSSNFLQTNS